MRILLATFVLFSGFSFAQITITNSDFSDGGDTVWVSKATDPTIDFLTTGADQTWDFSGLIAEEQVFREYFSISDASFLTQFMFGLFAPPKYQATNFASSEALPLDQLGAFLPVEISDVSQFSKNSSDSITSIGFSITVEGQEVPVKSDTIETRYKFPMNYGDVYSSRGYTYIDMNPIFNAIWIQYRQRSSNVDGWGSITTPYGTFDALRIRHDIAEIDSIYFDINGFATWFQLPIPPSTIYEWWAVGELEPVLRITVSEFFGTETVSDIEFKDIYLGLDAGLADKTLSLAVYPNPTYDLLTVDGINIGASILIVDASGKEMLSTICTKDSTEFDVSSFAQGSYLVIVREANGSFGTSTFVKQ